MPTCGEWQKIETAPRDGTWISGWHRSAQPGEMVTQWWTSCWGISGWRWDRGFSDAFTHWKPLSEPPDGR